MNTAALELMAKFLSEDFVRIYRIQLSWKLKGDHSLPKIKEERERNEKENML